MLSVVMCAKDMESTIIRSVESLAIGEPDAEIILVDDGSEDSTPMIMDVFAAEVPNIVAIHLGANKGLLQARKAGFLASHGDYVAFMDADDDISAGYYSNLVRICPDDGIAIGPAIQSYTRLAPPESFCLDDLSDTDRSLPVTYIWNKVFPRSLLERMFDNWDVPYLVHLEDTVFMSRAMFFCKSTATSDFGAYRQPVRTRRDVPFGDDRIEPYRTACSVMMGFLPKERVMDILEVRWKWDGFNREFNPDSIL